MRTMALALFVAFMVAGCASIRAYPVYNTKKFNEIAERNPRWAAAKQLTDKYSLDKVSAQYDNQPEAVKKEFRNNYINAHILATDLIFEDFQHVLAREGVLFNLGTDLSQLALTGATAVVPLKETKTVLSAVSTGIGGAKGSVDKNLFFKQTMDVLLVKMKANRAEVLASIQKNMKDLDTQVYPLTAAILDLEAYYRAGTLPQALLGILEKSGETIKKSKDETQVMLRASGTPPGGAQPGAEGQAPTKGKPATEPGVNPVKNP